MNRSAFGGASLRARTLHALAVFALAGCTAFGAQAADVAPAQTVDITKFMFMPMEVTVEPGATARWANHDEPPHTVASQGQARLFAPKAMDTDDHFDFVFTQEGDY